MSPKEKVHPSVKKLPLSSERIQKVRDEIIESLKKNAVGRKIIKTTLLEKDDKRREESGFISVGLNHIVDKIWFVESVFDDTFYSCEGIGRAYGRAIADGETSHIVKRILDKCKENKVEFTGEIHPSDILRSLEWLQQRKVEAKVILANVKDQLDLWQYRNLYAQSGRLCVPKGFSGYNHDIEINFFRGLPEGTLIFTDPEKIGELLIKESAKNTASISEIMSSERAGLLKTLPSLQPETLDEKIRLRVYETFKVNIVEPKAGLILKRKSKAKRFTDSDSSKILFT